MKLLYQLLKGPLSLQEMSVQFNTSKTTLHHQLSILKAFLHIIKQFKYTQIISQSDTERESTPHLL
ncbi:HTH domain-containing protein [Lysinibacillus sp. RC46]|uniref:HTH domain-containing protein n=1 Tax=Lysinibacillus sp. RC46 TaxID=3156295 RepID=UPI003518B23E